jgi:hypothetical protein
MKIIILFLIIMNGELIKMPVVMELDQSCSDIFIKIIDKNNLKTIAFRNREIFAYYCKTHKGDWIS